MANLIEFYLYFLKTFMEHTSYGYQYNGTQGIVNTYVVGISECDIMLIQTFPLTAMNRITKYEDRVYRNTSKPMAALQKVYLDI